MYDKTGEFSGNEWSTMLARYRSGERPDAAPASTSRGVICNT